MVKRLFLISILLVSSHCFAADGVPVGEPVTLTASLPSPQGQYNPKVACNGSGIYLVVWEQGANFYPSYKSSIYAARVQTNGSTLTVLDKSGIQLLKSPYAQMAPKVIYGGGYFFVVWMEQNVAGDFDIRGMRVDANGVSLDATGITIAGGAYNEITPDICYDSSNNRYFVVWNDFRTGSGYRIYGSRVMTNGKRLDPNGILLGKESVSITPLYPVVGTNGSFLLVSWAYKLHNQWATGWRITRYTLDGSLLNEIKKPGRFSDVDGDGAVDDTPYPEPMLKIASDGTDFVLLSNALFISRGLFRYHLPLFKIDENGTLIDYQHPILLDPFGYGGLGADATYMGGTIGFAAVFMSYAGGGIGREVEEDTNVYIVRTDKAVTTNIDYRSPVVVAESAAAERVPAIAGGGNSALVVYEEDNLKDHPHTQILIKARAVRFSRPETTNAISTSNALSSIKNGINHHDREKLPKSSHPEFKVQKQSFKTQVGSLKTQLISSKVEKRSYDQASTPDGSFRLPVTVKETAGVGSDGYPIDVVIPLSKGAFANSKRFRMTDAQGTPVAAQFNVINRWIDGSIRHLKVNFQPSVAAYKDRAGKGNAVYYLTDDGTDSAVSSPLSVDTSNPDTITVITGPLKFTVEKKHFAIINQAWLDTNNDGSFDDETPILKSSPSNGGNFEGLWGRQLDSTREDIVFDVEESGPMRAVIKAWAPTLFYGADYKDGGDGTDPAHQHGFAVRIYAYAGKPYVKIDYQLQNAAKNAKWSWPLYFDRFNLDFALNMTPANIRVRADQGNGAIESGLLSNYANGLVLKNIGPVTATDNNLRNTPDSIFRIEQGDGSLEKSWQIDETELYDAPPMSTFLDVDNGTFGVAITMRNFWQMWPNGLKIGPDATLSAQMWPEWSCFWNDDGGSLGWNGSCSDPNYPARWGYWLFDMQYTYKEAMLYFHESGISDAELQNWAKTTQYYPVGIIKTAQWQSASATLDMGGMIPVDEKLSSADKRRPTYTAKDFDLTKSGCQRNNKFGWNSFYFNDKPRKFAPNNTGSQPETAAALITSENPADYWMALDHGMASINISPQAMSEDYTYTSDWDHMRLQSSRYPGASWRAFGGPKNFMAADFLPGSYLMQKARDDAHGWWYHVEYSFYLTGNPWIKDWYKFIAEFRKGTLSHPTTAGGQSRAVGHHLGHAFQAYRVTGDTELLDSIQNYIKRYLRPASAGGIDPGNNVTLQNAQYGHIPFVNGDDMPYMMSFLIRQIMTYMDEIKDSDPQAWAEAFQFVSGQIEANLNYLNWDYRCDPIKGLNPKGEPCRSNSISAYILADPVSWYYAITGKSGVLANLKNYLNNGINGGTHPGMWHYLKWTDQFTGRWAKYVWEHEPLRADLTPPATITDLKAKRTGDKITLFFTPPVDATRYHVVYSDKPISECANPDAGVCNWWAAGVYGSVNAHKPFRPEIRADYVAVFTFDVSDNMSKMSNIARTE